MFWLVWVLLCLFCRKNAFVANWNVTEASLTDCLQVLMGQQCTAAVDIYSYGTLVRLAWLPVWLPVTGLR